MTTNFPLIQKWLGLEVRHSSDLGVEWTHAGELECKK